MLPYKRVQLRKLQRIDTRDVLCFMRVELSTELKNILQTKMYFLPCKRVTSGHFKDLMQGMFYVP